MNLWNVRNLAAPPTTTIKTKKKDINLHKLLTSCGTLQLTLSDQTFLHAEAAMLSRCLYRIKTKLRCDKGMKAMEKTNKALLRYLRMNYIRDLNNFISVIPRKYDGTTYMPTQNMVDFMLVRTQGFAKLMTRIAESAQIAANYLQNRIEISHFWKIALVALAIVARIFVIVRHILKRCCIFYDDLKGVRSKFTNTSEYRWLPEDYEYPGKLEDWLEVDWIHADLSVMPMPSNENLKRFFIDDDDDTDVEIVDEYLNISDENELKPELDDIKNKFEKVLTKSNDELLCELMNIDDDIGDSVAKNEVIVSKKSKNRILTDMKKLVEPIKSMEQFEVFVKEENKLRCNNKSRLQHLDKTQWNILYKSLKKIIKQWKGNKNASLLHRGKAIIKSSFN